MFIVLFFYSTIWNSTTLSNIAILITTFITNFVYVFFHELPIVGHDDLIWVTLWKYISLSCVHNKSCRWKHRFLEGSRVWMRKMTSCENTEGRKHFFFCRWWFLKPFEGVYMEESPMNNLQLFIEVFIIGIGGGVCKKTRPTNRLFNTQVTILTLPYQCIVLIVVHWSFHSIIIIWVKVLCIIILMVFLIGIIGCWCFCGTCRRWSLLIGILTNLQKPFNKVVTRFVVNLSVNDCIGNWRR